MFTKDDGPTNRLASLIEQRHRIEGDVILMDDVKDLTLKDLEPILTCCKGHRTYQKEKRRQALIDEIQRLRTAQSSETSSVWAQFRQGTIQRLELRLLQC